MSLTEIFTAVLNACFVGFGTALGSWLANRSLIEKLSHKKSKKA